MNQREFDAIKKAIEDYTEKITASPEAARRALVAEGIYNEDGTLHENYGGLRQTGKTATQTAMLEYARREYPEKLATLMAEVQPIPSEALMPLYNLLALNPDKHLMITYGEGSYDPKSGGC